MALMASKGSSNVLDPAPILSAYKPRISQIKISTFKPWIEKRLTELLGGLEDEILWDLVYNYLEDAQKLARREGPEANPSGNLDGKAIQVALSGFLSAKVARDFVQELFLLLQSAETGPLSGIPLEFGLKPEAAEHEALQIIQRASKRSEVKLSDRVGREIRRTSRYNRREYDRPYRRSRSRSRSESRSERSRRHSRSNYRSRSRSHSRSRPRPRSRPRSRSRSHSRSRRYYRNDHSHCDRSRSRSRSRYDQKRFSPSRRQARSPIPSSSPENSPRVSRKESSWENGEMAVLPQAPSVEAQVSEDLQRALRERAKSSMNTRK